MFVRANDSAVMSLALSLPIAEAWLAELVVDTPDMTGAVDITIDDRLRFRGTVVQGGGFLETTTIRVLAGAGKIGQLARARHYGGVRVGTVLSDLARDVGESISSTADPAVLNTRLDAWSTMAMPTGKVISLLLTASKRNAAWRFLPDGRLWVGVETWPDSGLADADYQVIDEHPAQRSAIIAPNPIPPLPGTTLAGRRLSRVEYRVGHMDVAYAIRAVVFYADA